MFARRLKHSLKMGLFKTLIKLAPGQNYVAFAGNDSSAELGRHIALNGAKRVLVVTDKPLVELGICDRAIAGLAHNGVEYVVFDGVLPDPTYGVVDKGRALFDSEHCDTLLAVGGGSSIDCAKGIGVALTHPGPLANYAGMGKVKDEIPPLYAIPTTAGTGSEATQGAVLSDDDTHEKSIISGKHLLPLAVALDPQLMVGMPPAITAATGIDALTHAIEAYLALIERNNSKQLAASAIRLIYTHLPTAVADGNNLEARSAMAWAAYTAGKAINQVNVGNVHAIAHQLGAFYGIPHGIANALVLPHVLDCSQIDAREPLSELAALVGERDAGAFIDSVRALIDQVGIAPTHAAIRSSDIPAITARAIAEGDGYPVRHLMTETEIDTLLRAISAE